MSMTGLDKITERILADARAEADRILAEAETDVGRILAEHEARAEQISADMTAETERLALEAATRARASADMQKRNLLLQCRSELVDSVFTDTYNDMKSLSEEKYTSLLAGLLAACVLEQLEAERTSRALYGEEEAIEPEAYEVILNMRDRDRCGKALMEAAKKKLKGKISDDKLNRLCLAPTTAPIDGGLILRCGEVETNCSLSLLFAQLRRELEAEVGRAMFVPKKQN